MKTGAEIGVMQPERKEPPEAARGKEGSSASAFRGRECGPVDILISGSWPPELREGKSLLWPFVTAALKKNNMTPSMGEKKTTLCRTPSARALSKSSFRAIFTYIV